MRATIMYGAGDVRVENVPDAHLIQPTDARLEQRDTGRAARYAAIGTEQGKHRQEWPIFIRPSA